MCCMRYYFEVSDYLYVYILSCEKCVENCSTGVRILWRKEACARRVSLQYIHHTTGTHTVHTKHTMVHILHILHTTNTTCTLVHTLHHWYTYCIYYKYYMYTGTYIRPVQIPLLQYGTHSATHSANTYINE